MEPTNEAVPLIDQIKKTVKKLTGQKKKKADLQARLIPATDENGKPLGFRNGEPTTKFGRVLSRNQRRLIKKNEAKYG